jgi:DNA end-binding protein Ku
MVAFLIRQDFVDAKEIDYRFFERPYFLVPADQMAGEGYAVIRDALRKTGKVGVAQLTIAGREWLVAVAPLEDGLVMEMLRYADELRDPAEYFDEAPTAKSQKDVVDLAAHCNIACPQGSTFPAGTLG